MNKVIKFGFFLLIITVISSEIACKRHRTSQKQTMDQKQITEHLIGANQASIKFENEQIKELIRKSSWQMTETPTGLRYQILEQGNGPLIKFGDVIKCEYEVRLITNELIYSSLKQGLKEFRVGSGGVESGLEEAVLLMKVGDKMRLIIPSYLAHGVSGDQDKIPPKATLIYIVKPIEKQ